VGNRGGGTRKTLGDFLDLEDLGAKNLKGTAEPVRSWDRVAWQSGWKKAGFEELRTGDDRPLGRCPATTENRASDCAAGTQAKGWRRFCRADLGAGYWAKSRITGGSRRSALGTEARIPPASLFWLASIIPKNRAQLYPAIFSAGTARGVRRDDTPGGRQRLDKLETVLYKRQRTLNEIRAFTCGPTLDTDR